MFDTVKFKNIRFLLGTPEGFLTPTGVSFTFDEWMSLCKFGRTHSKRGRKPMERSKKDSSQGLFDDKQVLPEKVLSEKTNSDDAESEETYDKNAFSEEVVTPSFLVTPEPTLNFDEDDDNVNFYFIDKKESEDQNTFDVEEVSESDDDDEEDLTPIEIVETEETHTETDDIEDDADDDDEPVEEITPPVEKKKSASEEEKVEEEEKKVTAVEPVTGTLESDLAKVDGVTVVTNLFKLGAVSRAMLALHALKDFIAQTEPDVENWAAYLSDEVGFILDDPLTLQTVKNYDSFTLWSNSVEIPKANVGKIFDYLNLAAMIKSFFAPHDPTSYQIQKAWRQINDDKVNTALKAYPAAKTLISLFNNFIEKTHRAFADCLVGAGNSNEDNFKEIMGKYGK